MVPAKRIPNIGLLQWLLASPLMSLRKLLSLSCLLKVLVVLVRLSCCKKNEVSKLNGRREMLRRGYIGKVLLSCLLVVSSELI